MFLKNKGNFRNFIFLKKEYIKKMMMVKIIFNNAFMHMFSKRDTHMKWAGVGK